MKSSVVVLKKILNKWFSFVNLKIERLTCKNVNPFFRDPSIEIVVVNETFQGFCELKFMVFLSFCTSLFRKCSTISSTGWY